MSWVRMAVAIVVADLTIVGPHYPVFVVGMRVACSLGATLLAVTVMTWVFKYLRQ